MRLAYHIVMNDNYCGIKIAHSIENALKNITKCVRCGSMSEHEICEFCLMNQEIIQNFVLFKVQKIFLLLKTQNSLMENIL